MRTLTILGYAVGLLCLGSCAQHQVGHKPQQVQAIAQEREAIELYLKGKILDPNPEPLPQGFPAVALEGRDIAAAKQELWQTYQRIALADAPELARFDEPSSDEIQYMDRLYNGDEMPYLWVRKPYAGARAERPFIIHLHGGGIDHTATGTWDGSINEKEWQASYYLSAHYREDGNALYFVPRMVDDRSGRWYLPSNVAAFKRLVKFAYAGGWSSNRHIYMMGISEGGYGTHRLALYMPDWFAGFGVMAAAEGVRHVENLANTAFRIDMGESDTGYGRITNARAWQAQLEQMKQGSPELYNHAVGIQQGRGHGIDYFRSAPWLVQQSRQAQPRSVRYEWHNMIPDYGSYGQLYADGVYCLDFRHLQPNGSTLSVRVDRGYEERGGKYYHSYHVSTQTTSGSGAEGELGLYIDNEDGLEVVIYHNGQELHRGPMVASRSTMAESLALWGDPLRIYPAKYHITLSK